MKWWQYAGENLQLEKQSMMIFFRNIGVNTQNGSQFGISRKDLTPSQKEQLKKVDERILPLLDEKFGASLNEVHFRILSHNKENDEDPIKSEPADILEALALFIRLDLVRVRTS